MSDLAPEDRVSKGIQRIGFVAWSLLGTMLLLAAIGWVLLRFRVLLPAVVLAIATPGCSARDSPDGWVPASPTSSSVAS